MLTKRRIAVFEVCGNELQPTIAGVEREKLFDADGVSSWFALCVNN